MDRWTYNVEFEIAFWNSCKHLKFKALPFVFWMSILK